MIAYRLSVVDNVCKHFGNKIRVSTRYHAILIQFRKWSSQGDKNQLLQLPYRAKRKHIYSLPYAYAITSDSKNNHQSW